MDGGITGTIVGGVLGFAAAIAPVVLDALLRRQQTSDPAAATGHVSDGTYVPEDEPVPSADDLPRSSGFVETLRGTVRPTITYLFFGTFVFIKIRLMYHALYVDRTPAINLLPILWNDGSEALFAAVIAFWFGSRAISRIRG